MRWTNTAPTPTVSFRSAATIYGQGVDVFAKRCAELAAKYGAGFALKAEVIATLKQHQPVS